MNLLPCVVLLACLASAAAQTCPAGSVPDGFGYCNECYSGQYAAVADGKPACLECPVNTITEKSGQTSCTECPAGSYTDTEGSSFCTDCSYGEFLAVEAGKRLCKPCPINTFAAAPRSTSCKPCPPGTLTYYDRSSSCEACPVSTVPSNKSGSQSCEACPDGQYTPTKGSAPCRECPVGSYIAMLDLDTNACKQCPAGTAGVPGKAGACYEDAIQLGCCPDCLPGTYTAKPGATKCDPCPAGTYQPDKGAAQCIPCPAGSYSAQPGATACTKASVGFFQPKAGSKGQLACPANTVGLVTGGVTLQDTCIPYLTGTYSYSEKQNKLFVYKISGDFTSMSTAVESIGDVQPRSMKSAGVSGPCGGEVYSQETFYSCSRYPYSSTFDKSTCAASPPGGKGTSSCKTYKFYALPDNKFAWVIDAGAREPSVCILDKATKNDIICQYIEDASTRSYIGEWATFSDVQAASDDAGKPAGPVGEVGPEVGAPPAIEDSAAAPAAAPAGGKATSSAAAQQSAWPFVLYGAFAVVSCAVLELLSVGA